ncbi:MAG TPA: long-chain fatty acid--CoA ligase [Actinomycetota bacterium]|nr:long-chain fatty acid--CoA ligase [Actinomycetota bacterium]
MNLSLLLRETARAHAEKTALFCRSAGGSSEVTFGAIDEAADRVAAGLIGRGVAPGDRVVLGMTNVPHFAYAYYGALRAGATVVPLNPTLTAVETERILEDSGAKVVLATPGFAERAVTPAAAELGSSIEIVSTDDWDIAFPSAGPIEDIEVDGDDLAILAYTSGTTGEPKGVMLSHGNLRANLEQQMAVPDADVREDDILLLALPLFHIFGLNVTLGLLVMTGASGLLVEQFEPVDVLTAMQEVGVTVIFGAPTLYIALVNTPGADQYDLSKVRLAISGAAALAPGVLRSFKELFGVQIYEGYGLTETAPTVTSNRITGEARPGSIGRPVPGLELRLVDEGGDDVELGDPGEIVVRGPNVFKGYWGHEEDTANAFFGDWFRTGDVAVLDEEGYLYLVDRKRDLIIVSGFNVYPSEVEEALIEHPAILEAAVIGVPHQYTGEAVKAYVALQPGTEATEEELLAYVGDRLARFKCPRSIEIVAELPHLLTGKVLKRALRS